IHYHERHHGFARTTDTRVPVADATSIRILLGDTAIDPAQGECLAFERTLDFRQGRLFRSLRWRTSQGHVLEVVAERVVALAHPGLVCIRWTLRAIDYAGPVSLESSIFGDGAAAVRGDDPRFGTGAGLAMRVTHSAVNSDDAWLVQRTSASEIGVACAQRHRVTGASLAGSSQGANGVQQVFVATLARGEEITIEKYIAYAWTRPEDALANLEFARRCAGPRFRRARWRAGRNSRDILGPYRPRHRYRRCTRRARRTSPSFQSVSPVPIRQPRQLRRHCGQGFDRRRLRGPRILGFRNLRPPGLRIHSA
ncbi:MAG: hypothetical protein E6K53_16005, partial [Gammaproteobacteria bacterium]